MRTPLVRTALSLALLAALSPFAHAADAPAPAPQDGSSPATQDGKTPTTDEAHHAKVKQLDTVVVTASPLKTNAENLAQPVDVLSGQQLDTVRAATLGETVSSIPGVQTSNFGAGVGRPIIRGLDGPRVAVLSDGLASQDVSTVSQDHAPAVEPFLADQIEVLKGPSTLLYGSSAIGGLVNVVDGRIPQATLDAPFTGRAEYRHDSVSDGNTAMFRFDGGNEHVVLHADGVWRDLGNYDTPLGIQQNSFVKTKTGALGGSLVGDWGYVGFSAARYEDQYGNPGEPGDPALGDKGVHLAMVQNRFEVKGSIHDPFAGVSGLQFNIGNTDYTHTEFEGDNPGTVFNKTATEGRVQLTLAPIAGWDSAVGVQVSSSDFEAIGEESFVPRTSTHAAGAFVFGQREFGPVQVDLGARVDSVKSTPATMAARSFTPLSLSAGAIWKLDQSWRLSLNLDHAERAPAEEELFANGPHIATLAYEIGDANLKKEASNQIEFGLHHHSARFDSKIALYSNHFTDFIYITDTGNTWYWDEGQQYLPIRQWSQRDAWFRGLEAEGTWHITDNEQHGQWDLRVFGDTVRATFGNGGGNVPRIAPARLGAELSWQGQQWRGSFGAVRTMKQNKIAADETPTNGFTFVNAHVAWHFDRGTTGWELFLDGTNLTNQVGRVATSFLKDSVVLPGRSVSAGVRVFF